MTLASGLISRVRSNLNEPSTVADPLRTDAEILQWLQDAQEDYLHKVPQEHFPELVATQAFTGAAVALPSNYKFFHGCTVTRTYSGTYQEISDCWVLKPGDTYLSTHYPGVLGSYCQITGSTISCGPATVVSGTLTYVKAPTVLSTSSITFSLGSEHESPIVSYATAMALAKVNDADADGFIKLYQDNVAAKVGRKESGDIERA